MKRKKCPKAMFAELLTILDLSDRL